MAVLTPTPKKHASCDSKLKKRQPSQSKQPSSSSWDQIKNLVTCKAMEISKIHHPCAKICNLRDVIHGNTRIIDRADKSPEMVKRIGCGPPHGGAMQLRKLSGCYECHAVSTNPMPRSNVFPCSQCGEIFPKKVVRIMGAIAKLLSYPDKILSIFFFRIFPELIHLSILALCIFFKYCQIFTTRRSYAAAVRNSRRKLRSLPDSGECSVCLSDLAEAGGEECCELAACGHAFHRRCVERWLKGYAPTCPLCRAAVVPEAIAAEHQRLLAEEEDDWIEKEFALVLLNALDVGRCNHRFFS